MRKTSRTEEQLNEIQSKIDKANAFTRELQVPSDIAPALLTGRLELLKLAKPRALSASQCAVLYQLIGGLLETNQALQQHASFIASMASDLRGSLRGATSIAARMESYANFQEPRNWDEGDDE